MQSTILTTKIHQPASVDNQVIRQDIIQYLEGNITKPVSLVSAPAGYGKSETVAQWVSQTDAKSCWVSLDYSNNDLRMFLSYLVTSIHNMIPDVLVETTVLLNAGDLPPQQVIAHSLINELDLIQEDFIVVLDDYHLIENETIHNLIDEVLRYPPQHLHLCLVTRRDPPLKLNSLLAKGRMVEVRLNNLAFTDDEVIELYQKLWHTILTRDKAHALKEKTEGWIVALRMASVFSNRTANFENLIANFDGSVYSLSEYLLEEIIEKQSADLQEALLKACFLNRFCNDLIQTIIQKDSGELMPQLVQSNLFIIHLDNQRKWFRFHHLIQEFLQGIAQKHYSLKAISKTHQLASSWYEQHGFVEEAIEHMLASENVNQACQIVERNRTQELDNDRWYVVHRWLQKFKKSQTTRPHMLLSSAWAAYENFQFEEMHEHLQNTDPLLTDEDGHKELRGEWNLMMGLLTFWSGFPDVALDHFNHAKSQLEEKENLANGMLHLHTAMALCLNGELDLAMANVSSQIVKSNGHPVYLTRLHAGAFYNHMFSGALAKAKLDMQKAIAIGKEGGIAYTEAMANCMGATAWFCANQLEEALEMYGQLKTNRYIIHKITAIDALSASVIAHELLGQQDAADGVLKDLFKFCKELDNEGYLALANSCKARLGVIRDDLKWADNWQMDIPEQVAFASLFIWIEVPALTKVRVLIKKATQKSLDQAEAILQSFEKKVLDYRLVNHQIEILVLKTVLAILKRQKEKALITLKKAIELGEEGSWIRPFVEWFEELMPIMDYLDDNSVTHFTERIKKALINRASIVFGKEENDDAADISSDAELLSFREQEVIKLVAQGYRNKEIAELIHVSESTIKKHIYHIGQKWDLHNRISIVQRAIELKYL